MGEHGKARLGDVMVKNAKWHPPQNAKNPDAKPPRMMLDGEGLYLKITHSGVKTFVYRFTLKGRTRDLTLGTYPAMSLKDARDVRNAHKLNVDAGVDPIEKREADAAAADAAKAEQARQEKEAEEARKLDEARRVTFSQAVDAYLQTGRIKNLTNEKHRKQWRSTLDTYAGPLIGDMHVGDITDADIKRVLGQKVDDEGNTLFAARHETASRLRGRIEAVLNADAIRKIRTGENPASREALKSWIEEQGNVKTVTLQPAVSIEDMPAWFAELQKREGNAARCLELAVICTNRSAEPRGAVWTEFQGLDGDNPVWVIPAARQKVKKRKDGKPVEDHRIPLPPAAVALLAALPRMAGSPYVFPAVRGGMLSDMALSQVMRRMHADKVKRDGVGWIDAGSKRPAVPHGTCRATFRSWAADRGYDYALAERQLSHEIGNMAARVYQRSDMLERRRAMLADWSAFCHGEEVVSGNVVQLRGAV